MKALITADWHLTDKDDDEYRWEFVEEFLPEILKDYKVRTLMILGDLTEKKDKHSSKLVNRLIDVLNMYFEKNLIEHIIILKGNHDFIDKDTPYFKFLNNNKNITFINYISEFFDINGKDIVRCLAYQRDMKDIDEYRIFNTEDTKYIFLHQDLKGAVLENGYELESKNVFDYSKISDDIQIISGHIHVPQQIKKNVQYVGSPYPIIYGTNDTDYGVLIIDDDKMEHLKTNTYIRKLIFKVNSIGELKKKKFNEGDRIKIVLNLKKSDVGEWQKHKKEIIAYMEKQDIYSYKLDIKVKQEKEQKKADVKKDSDFIFDFNQIFDSYCKEKKVKQGIIDIGKDLLEN